MLILPVLVSYSVLTSGLGFYFKGRFAHFVIPVGNHDFKELTILPSTKPDSKQGTQFVVRNVGRVSIRKILLFICVANAMLTLAFKLLPKLAFGTSD